MGHPRALQRDRAVPAAVYPHRGGGSHPWDPHREGARGLPAASVQGPAGCQALSRSCSNVSSSARPAGDGAKRPRCRERWYPARGDVYRVGGDMIRGGMDGHGVRMDGHRVG